MGVATGATAVAATAASRSSTVTAWQATEGVWWGLLGEATLLGTPPLEGPGATDPAPGTTDARRPGHVRPREATQSGVMF